MADQVSYFGETNGRTRVRFGIRQADRLSHIYVIGKTGTGKSTLLETLFMQDVEAGRGAALIDPHGDLAARVVEHFPADRRNDLVYVDLPDGAQPFGYNPIARVGPEHRSLVASGLMEVFEKLWPNAWGQRMEHILRNSLLVLLEQPDAVLPDILRLYSDKAFRRAAALNCTNEPVRHFWLHEYAQFTYRYQAEAVAPIQNKVGAFLADRRLYRFFATPEKPLRFRQIMDDRKVLIVNLAKGQIGADSANIVGGLIMTALSLAAFSRAAMPQESRRPFAVFADEFQDFTTLSVATMAAELRKYAVSLVMANQYLHQLAPAVLHAVLGNAGTLISFRVGAEDAYFLSRELEPKFLPIDLINLPNYNFYLRLMVDGAPSTPFSARALMRRT